MAQIREAIDTGALRLSGNILPNSDIRSVMTEIVSVKVSKITKEQFS
jgi:hypothetical protein